MEVWISVLLPPLLLAFVGYRMYKNCGVTWGEDLPIAGCIIVGILMGLMLVTFNISMQFFSFFIGLYWG